MVVSVNAGELAPEVDEGRHLVHPVLLGVPRVVHLDHGDVQSICFVVYLLQSFDCLVAFNTVVFIKVDSHKFVFIKKFFQQLSVHFFNLIFCLKYILGRQPLQDPLSVHEIAIKHNGGHPSEINECWRVVDVVLPRRVWVVVLDKVDAKSVRLVVNLLQAFKNCVTLNALIIVEEDSYEGGSLEKLVEHAEVDGLYLVLKLPVVVVRQPFQHRIFRFEVTVKCKRVAVAEVYKSRESFDPVPLGQRRVFELDHLNSILIALVVNVLKLGDDLVTGAAVLLVEEDGEVLHLDHHRLQHRPSDQLNVRLNLHFDQPVENLLLNGEVSLIKVWNAFFEENKCRIRFHSNFLGEGSICCLHHGNPLFAHVVVDILQLCQGFQAAVTFLM